MNNKAKKIEKQTGGRAVKSTDPRKPIIMQAFKTATGCTKVTSVKETAPNTFQANCLIPMTPWEGEGFYELAVKF